MYNCFMAGKNSCGVSLSYFIRKNIPSTKDSEKRDIKIIHQASLVGCMFARDSRKVINIIKELTLGTESETWIKGLKCGIKVMQEIQANYGGTSEGVIRKKFARVELKKTLYRNKTTFKFDK